MLTYSPGALASTSNGASRLRSWHCHSDGEFRDLQAYRGRMSGEARRARTMDRDREIFEAVRAGVKLLALSVRHGLSVSQVSRIAARLREAVEYFRGPLPVALARFFGRARMGHTHCMNRKGSRRKIDTVREDMDLIGSAACIFDDLRASVRASILDQRNPICPCCGRSLGREGEH